MATIKAEIDYNHSFGVVRKVTLPNGEQWNLNGICNRCGDCCLNMKIPMPEFNDENGLCKYIGWETVDGERLCKCNTSWCKPADCILYPIDPYDELYENCSYEWERVK